MIWYGNFQDRNISYNERLEKKNVTILELEQTSKKSVVIASQAQKIIKLKEINWT